MTTAAGPDAVEDSLVLNLDAGNYRSYPGSGNTWYDLSGSKTNCTLVNNPSFSISNGGFLIFTGTQFGIVPLPSVLTVSNFSYNIWVYPTALGGWQTMIDQDNDDFLFATLGSTVQLYDQSINTGINLSVNTWYNLSVTYNSGSPVLFYKNGKLEYNGPNASTNTYDIKLRHRRWNNWKSTISNSRRTVVGKNCYSTDLQQSFDFK